MSSIDSVTGLSINGKVYKEGVTYKNFRAPTFLLDSRFARTNATFSISQRRLEITYGDPATNTAGKLVAKGRSVFKGDESIAKDFKIKKLIEANYAQSKGLGRLIRNSSSSLGSPASFNNSYDFLVNNPRKSKGKFFPQSSKFDIDSVSFKGLTVNPFTDPVAKNNFQNFFKGYTSAFKNDWWEAVLPGKLI
jgi:hypothetical protein